jgi:translation initiation factor 4E
MSAATVEKSPTEQLSDAVRVPRCPGDHALHSGWCFWYDKRQKPSAFQNATATVQTTVEYRNRLHKIGAFDTIEGFWKLFVHLKRPSILDPNVNLYLFRDGPQIVPMWEAFPKGGFWILKIKKKKDSGVNILGKFWQDLVVAMIGENFEDPNVVGISISIRKYEDLLSIWVSDSRNDDVKFGIGQKVKEILDLDPSTLIEYKSCDQSSQDMSSFKNAKQYVYQSDSDTEGPK